jgi:hypothetical protein
MTAQIPVFYDSTQLVHRPMDLSDTLNTQLMPVSARPGNTVQNLTDGLYVGQVLASTVYYVSSAGTDVSTGGTKAAPFKTLDYALSQLTAQSVGNQYTAGNTTIALAANQSFPMTADFNIYGGRITFAFYGDPQYGDFNSAPFGTGAQPAVMSDLQRPIIVPTSNNVNSQWYLTGINRYGGNVAFTGVTILLPVAPAQPSITLYSQSSDFVRSMNYSSQGYVSLFGSSINMQDPNSFWGFLGIRARSTGTTLDQFASQFLVNGIQLSAANTPTSGQLTARQYFVKLYVDFPGNLQTTGVLSSTTQNSSTASGLLNLTWADTEALTVATGKTNLASFPICFDLSYGFRNYVFGLQDDQQSRPMNIVSSRLF